MAKTWTTPPSESLRAGSDFVLADVDTRSTPGFSGDKAYAAQALESGRETLSELQEKLFAGSRSGGDRGNVLLVLQAMDTAGKGGIVRHVVGAVDPQGVAPSRVQGADRRRARPRLPLARPPRAARPRHDRRLRPVSLRGRADRQGPRAGPARRDRARYDQIVEFEDELAANGTTVIKVMLHISFDEQKERLAERLDRPDKYWKYNPGDVDERNLWADYQDAYETAIRRTSTETCSVVRRPGRPQVVRAGRRPAPPHRCPS